MPIIDRDTAARRLNVISILFLILGLALGIWFMFAYKVADADYLAKSIAYPSLYPAAETPMKLNFLLGISVFAVFGFFSAVCYGIRVLIAATIPAKTTAPGLLSAKKDTDTDYTVCPQCGKRQPARYTSCFNCNAKLKDE